MEIEDIEIKRGGENRKKCSHVACAGNTTRARCRESVVSYVKADTLVTLKVVAILLKSDTEQ
jgi:hypothetical protein